MIIPINSHLVEAEDEILIANMNILIANFVMLGNDTSKKGRKQV
ncbi:hypothetical protein [Jeotgalibacillus proteolyticus]